MFHSKTDTKASAAVNLADKARGAGNAAAQSAQAATQAAAAQAAQAAAAQAAHAAHAAQEAAAHAAHVAQEAAEKAAVGVSVAAQGVGKSVRQGVHTARGWAAPRIENAADYTTDTVAPRVSEVLRTTARQVSPEDTRAKRSVRSTLSWTFLAAAVLTAAGAAAAVIRHRYRAAMEADTEADSTEAGTADDEAAGGNPAEVNGSAPTHDANADTGVNGRVSTSGR